MKRGRTARPHRAARRARSLGAPPLLVNEAQEAQFKETDALFQRLWVEVANNPNFKDTPDCNKVQVGQTYREEWEPYAKVWRTSLWDSFERADETKLNSLTGRANGWAKVCFPAFKNTDQVHGTDIEDVHKTAAWVDINAPGGGPPRPGTGVLGYKKSELVVGGVLLLGAAAALRLLFR